MYPLNDFFHAYTETESCPLINLIKVSIIPIHMTPTCFSHLTWSCNLVSSLVTTNKNSFTVFKSNKTLYSSNIATIYSLILPLKVRILPSMWSLLVDKHHTMTIVLPSILDNLISTVPAEMPTHYQETDLLDKLVCDFSNATPLPLLLISWNKVVRKWELVWYV